MKPKKLDKLIQDTDDIKEENQAPEIYAIKRGKSGWELSRRGIFQAAAAAVAAAGAPGKVQAQGCPAGAKAHRADINSLAISRDGRLLAFGSNDKTMKLWSLPDGAHLKTLEDQSGYVLSVAISPDGRRLASGGWKNTVKLWPLPDGALMKTLEGHNGYINSLAISPDGEILASGSRDYTIRLWSLPERVYLNKCLMDVDGSSSTVSAIRYTRDGVTCTLPCGSPIPPGAVCTCNCVPGCSCVAAHYWYPT
jgi:WD40 repeat protein